MTLLQKLYERQKDTVYSVKARIRIGRGNQYFHDCGEIGIVSTPEEAVKKYSSIKWTSEGLTIGSGENQYFLKREIIESHR